MWGGPQDVFLSFEFRVDRSPNFGATGGSKIAPSHSLDTSLYTTACCYRTSRDAYIFSKCFQFKPRV